jgi:hypothetical protein
MWPELKEKLPGVEEHDASGQPEPRESREILQEILELVRSLSPRNRITPFVLASPAGQEQSLYTSLQMVRLGKRWTGIFCNV